MSVCIYHHGLLYGIFYSKIPSVFSPAIHFTFKLLWPHLDYDLRIIKRHKYQNTRQTNDDTLNSINLNRQ